MTIHGVLGPIHPADLGVTSMHEHLFIDARVWFDRPEDPNAPSVVDLESLAYVRRHIHSVADNLVLDEPEIAAREAALFGGAGGATIVDLTPANLGRSPELLPQVARTAGVNIATSTALYVHDAHPDWVQRAGIDEIAEFFLAELSGGLGGTGIIPALIGEIGTSREITDREWRVVRAAGRAGAESGAAVNIHLDPYPTDALRILEALLSEGMPAERVIFSHMDEHLDLGYHREVARSGAVLEYDTFGAEFYWGDFHRDPTDVERVEHLLELLGDGYGDRIVLGCDVWIKATLRSYGGDGYAHLPGTIVPLLRERFGVGEEPLRQMLTGTPARLLDRP